MAAPSLQSLSLRGCRWASSLERRGSSPWINDLLAWHHLNINNCIYKDLVSKESYMLKFQMDINLTEAWLCPSQSPDLATSFPCAFLIFHDGRFPYCYLPKQNSLTKYISEWEIWIKDGGFWTVHHMLGTCAYITKINSVTWFSFSF